MCRRLSFFCEPWKRKKVESLQGSAAARGGCARIDWTRMHDAVFEERRGGYEFCEVSGMDGWADRTCKATDREWSGGRERARRGSTYVGKPAHTCQAADDVQAPSTRAPIFLLCARTLAYHVPLGGTRALASFSCPKRLSGGPNKRQTNPAAIEKLGQLSGRGAIALNFNG